MVFILWGWMWDCWGWLWLVKMAVVTGFKAFLPGSDWRRGEIRMAVERNDNAAKASRSRFSDHVIKGFVVLGRRVVNWFLKKSVHWRIFTLSANDAFHFE